MELTKEQQSIVDSILSGDSDVYAIRGYAGTGKTVTVSHLVRNYLTDRPSNAVAVLAPTAAALSVVENKLTNMAKDIYFRTIASVTSRPVESVQLPGDMPSIRLDGPGAWKLGKILKAQKIDSSNLLKVTNKRDYTSVFVDLNNPKEVLSNAVDRSDVIVSLNDDELTRRYQARYPDRPDRKNKVMSGVEHVLVTPEECAERISGLVRKSRFTGLSAVIVDEYSMVNEQTSSLLSQAIELVNSNVYSETYTDLIVCGDPGQLPPVDGEPNMLLSIGDDSHTFTLDTILRSGDEVATLAQSIRSGAPLSNLAYINDNIIKLSGETPEQVVSMYPDLFKQSGAVVTFRNKTVDAFNTAVRAIKGKSGSLKQDDVLVCTANTYGGKESSFRNGELLTIVGTGHTDVPEFAEDMSIIDKLSNLGGDSSNEYAALNMFLTDGSLAYCVVENRMGDRKVLMTWTASSRVDKSTRNLHEKIVNNEPSINVSIVPTRFAYSITVHKSQGSEWDNVIYYVTRSDMKMQGSSSQLSYTAVTRAKNNITVLYDPTL